mmetsp:Transcript_45857/g.82532  ORF Transcript_45857/g.82532 Transcript_45857/m.82532 type:complete len:1213 (-) Transcript_45857:97-3735(-)|eukprot:CAMPEP_0197673258 /NCGR_PEP_ID=MMETSP1338-20131121/80623_1 /TAXON_ID=43686 ORGANISM="Pelagodinium beii, Strain RCC1491" /NCGR_SAMPLE_ID=MMETSP1338 /ASSEMBLY_ACC=CAM_ASM_000754 /LENGTH=1212 /DNA_ID=CAMNT_0043253483 /DNA_START=129 /DNA_END=3767 /DNA_ORIENTATION=-
MTEEGHFGASEFADLLKQSDVIERASSIKPVFVKPPQQKRQQSNRSRPNTAIDREQAASRASTQAVDSPSPEPFGGRGSPESFAGALTPTPPLRPPSYQYKGRGALSIGGVSAPAVPRSSNFGDPSMEASRLDGNTQRSFRPHSAGRPSTAPLHPTKVRGGPGTHRLGALAGQAGQALAKDPTRFADRPYTAPPEGVPARPRITGEEDAPPVRPHSSLEIQGEALVEEDGYMPVPGEDEDLDDGLDQIAKDMVNDALIRRADRLDFQNIGNMPEVTQLWRVLWEPKVFLKLKEKVLKIKDPHGLHLLQRLVLMGTKQALDQMSYKICPNPEVQNDLDTTVDLSPFVGRMPRTRWYGDVAPHVNWSMDYEAEKAPANSVVSDLNPLDVVMYTAKAMEGHPIVLVVEVNSFDSNGDIDDKNLTSLAPDDLLLRTDLGRFLRRIKQESRQSNQNLFYSACTVRDYLQNSDQPFIIRCCEVTLFRGNAEKGFEFLKEPLKMQVLFMAMAQHRPKIQTVHYRTKGTGEWYEQLADYNAFANRMHLIAHTCHNEIAKEAGVKPVLIMALPGSVGHFAQPQESMMSCVKHWKQTFAHQFHCIHMCGRTHYGPSWDATVKMRGVMQLKDRPPPGLETHPRRGGGNKTKKRRLQGNISVLSDPSDEEYAVDEAVRTARVIAQRKIPGGAVVAGGAEDEWNVDNTHDFMKAKGDVQKHLEDAKEADGVKVHDKFGKRKSSGFGGFGGLDALALAGAAVRNAVVAEKVDKADMFGKISDSSEADRPAIYGPCPPMFTAAPKAASSPKPPQGPAKTAPSAVPATSPVPVSSDALRNDDGFADTDDEEVEADKGKRINFDQEIPSKQSAEVSMMRRGSAPVLGRSKTSFAPSTEAPSNFDAFGRVDAEEEEEVQRMKRRASTGTMRDFEQWQGEEMEKKVAEMKEMARKTIMHRSMEMKLTRNFERNEGVFEHRRKSSFQGQMGAGGEYHIFHGGGLGQQMSDKDRSWAKKGKGNNVRPAYTGISPEKQTFVSDESLNNRQELRNRLRRASLEREAAEEAAQKEGRRSSLTFREPPNSMPIVLQGELEVPNQGSLPMTASRKPEATATSQPRSGKGPTLARYMEYVARSVNTSRQELAAPPKDRPFASLETQFRRRTMRESILVYRARADQNLTAAGLREIELATAENEGAILKLAEKVVACQDRAYNELGDGITKVNTQGARHT